MARKSDKPAAASRPDVATTKPQASAIIWPATPQTTGTFNTIHPGLIAIDNLFSRQTLKSWLTFLDSPTSPITLQESLPGPPKKGNAARNNDRFGVQDDAFAKKLWEDSGLRELAQEGLPSSATRRKPVGLNGNVRLYRYQAGAYFG
ncbi:hypothetical protein P7C70_g9534, partial [Phenoliferia sp. Uapishka_3]